MEASLELVDETFARFRPARVFVSSPAGGGLEGGGSSPGASSTLPGPVTSLDIEPIDGEFGLASHGKQNALTLFSARLGVNVQRINHVGCENGVMLSRFTRRNIEASVLLASRVSNMDTTSFTIKLFALKANEMLRTFPGHAHQVCSLIQSPVDDCFLSADISSETRLWDARDSSIGCVGRLKALEGMQAEGSKEPSGITYLAYHPSGSSFFTVTAYKQRELRLAEYDLRKLARGPSRIVSVGRTTPEQGNILPADLKISPDGQVVVVVTTQKSIIALDATEGTFLYQVNCVSTPQSPAIVSFSADSKYLSTRAKEGALIIGANDGRYVNILETGESVDAARISCFSPKTELLVTSGEDATIFWSSSQQS